MRSTHTTTKSRPHSFLTKEHPGLSRTGPVYTNCPQLNYEQHIPLTSTNVQVCMMNYMVTLSIYPAHTQKLRWSKTGPINFCSKSTPLHIHFILINGTTTYLQGKTRDLRWNREKVRSLPSYPVLETLSLSRKISPPVLLPLTLVHVTIISHPDYYKSLLISLHLSSWLPCPTIYPSTRL